MFSVMFLEEVHHDHETAKPLVGAFAFVVALVVSTLPVFWYISFYPITFHPRGDSTHILRLAFRQRYQSRDARSTLAFASLRGTTA